MNRIIISYIWVLVFYYCGSAPAIGQGSKFEKYAKKGNPYSQYYFAEAYKKGDHVKISSKKARYWYKKSARQGLLQAKVGLGILYYQQHQYKKALYWLRQAAYQDDFNGQYYLGLMHYRGLGTRRHKAQAQYWFDKSRKNGQSEWRVWLAKGDTSKTFRWHTNQAKGGNVKSQFYLATMHEQGQGTPQDLNQAFNWYKKSMESYSSPVYDILPDWEGIPKNLWIIFRQQATSGNPEMQCKLAELYHKVEHYGKAFFWFEKSAQQGHATAQTTLGTMYFYGQGTNQSYKKAFQWYKKAAEQNHRIGQFDLAMAYYEGKGVAINKKKALYYFEKSAEQGFINAQLLLVHIYSADFKNYSKSFAWCSKAAAQGSAIAQYQLALYYRDGKGTIANSTKEKYWMTKAANNGLEKAKEALSEYKD